MSACIEYLWIAYYIYGLDEPGLLTLVIFTCISSEIFCTHTMKLTKHSKISKTKYFKILLR